MDRQQLGAAGALAAVELDRVEPQRIHPEAHRALGEAGADVENEILRPLFGLALRIGRVGEVAVDVEVAQVQVGAGIFNEALGERLQR
ncbi:hypothetical protein D3C72_1416690 [compost metagenome]